MAFRSSFGGRIFGFQSQDQCYKLGLKIQDLQVGASMWTMSTVHVDHVNC